VDLQPFTARVVEGDQLVFDGLLDYLPEEVE
jgi:hypothetical protein